VTQRDEFGQFVKTERAPMQPVNGGNDHDAFILVAMLVAVELIIVGACMIYGVAIGHGFERDRGEIIERGMERADDMRAILGGILFASGMTLGLLGFRR
jgi:hypothetical protein